MKPIICLVTGPPGVGKSTVADVLAKSFPKTARVNVDYLRHTIKKGYAPLQPHTGETEKQIRLAIKSACCIAKNLAEGGFIVFIDDVVASRGKLDYYFRNLNRCNLLVFLLMAERKILGKRDRGRGKKIMMGKRSLQLHDGFKSRINEKRWHLIDTSNHTAKQTAKAICKIIKSEISKK